MTRDEIAKIKEEAMKKLSGRISEVTAGVVLEVMGRVQFDTHKDITTIIIKDIK